MIISSAHFSFKDNIFSAFMSDIEYAIKRIYPDACDSGFGIMKNGKTVKFVEVGRSEDIFFFKPLREEIRRNPRLAKVVCKIFNT